MFRFRQALGFVAIITAVLLISGALNAWLGPSGAMAAVVVTALAELRAAVATVGNLSESEVLAVGTARWALVGLLGASLLAKTLVALMSGGAAFAIRVGIGLGVAAGAATLVRFFT